MTSEDDHKDDLKCDNLLTSSTIVRTPSAGRRRKEKLNYKFWGSTYTLSENVRNCQP